MKVEKTKLDGVLLVTPQVFGDDRGFFMETYNREKAIELGLPGEFVQDNHSKSSKGVLRGLHYQNPQWQGKLVRTVQGEIFDVAVDIRAGSTTFGEWVGFGSLLWNDPEIGIEWPIDSPLLSAKDEVGQRLADLPSLTVSD